VIDLVEGDTTGITSRLSSPLAAALVARGGARFNLGLDGWRDDLDRAVITARGTDPMSRAAVVNATYAPAIGAGVLLSYRRSALSTKFPRPVASSV
jgi:adenylate cyclase